MKNKTNTMPGMNTESDESRTGPATLDSAECPAPTKERKVSTMDPTLRAAAKLDRLVESMTPLQRAWVIQWINSKWMNVNRVVNPTSFQPLGSEPVTGPDPRD